MMAIWNTRKTLLKRCFPIPAVPHVPTVLHVPAILHVPRHKLPKRFELNIHAKFQIDKILTNNAINCLIFQCYI